MEKRENKNSDSISLIAQVIAGLIWGEGHNDFNGMSDTEDVLKCPLCNYFNRPLVYQNIKGGDGFQGVFIVGCPRCNGQFKYQCTKSEMFMIYFSWLDSECWKKNRRLIKQELLGILALFNKIC